MARIVIGLALWIVSSMLPCLHTTKVTLCGDDQKKLYCPSGSVIAFYKLGNKHGRSNSAACSTRPHCEVQGAFGALVERCWGRAHCDVTTDLGLLENSCTGGHAFLTFYYFCAKLSHISQTCRRDGFCRDCPGGFLMSHGYPQSYEVGVQGPLCWQNITGLNRISHSMLVTVYDADLPPGTGIMECGNNIHIGLLSSTQRYERNRCQPFTHGRIDNLISFIFHPNQQHNARGALFSYEYIPFGTPAVGEDDEARLYDEIETPIDGTPVTQTSKYPHNSLGRTVNASDAVARILLSTTTPSPKSKKSSNYAAIGGGTGGTILGILVLVCICWVWCRADEPRVVVY